MVADEIVGAIVEGLAYMLVEMVIPDGSWSRKTSTEREEIRTLLHAAATDTLPPDDERRLRHLLRRQGYMVEDVSHDELVQIARRSEEKAAATKP